MGYGRPSRLPTQGETFSLGGARFGRRTNGRFHSLWSADCRSSLVGGTSPASAPPARVDGGFPGTDRAVFSSGGGSFPEGNGRWHPCSPALPPRETRRFHGCDGCSLRVKKGLSPMLWRRRTRSSESSHRGKRGVSPGETTRDTGGNASPHWVKWPFTQPRGGVAPMLLTRRTHALDAPHPGSVSVGPRTAGGGAQGSESRL